MFFFVVTGSHTCGPIQTGTIAPFAGTVKNVGKNLVLNTPIPAAVSFPITGVEGSLTGETLHYLKVSKTVNGKAVVYQRVDRVQERQAAVQHRVHRGDRAGRHTVDPDGDGHAEVQLNS